MNIRQWFLVAIVALPLVELYLLIKLFGVLGFITTLALLLGAASLGMSLLRSQGLSTWMKVQHALARGETPALEMLESGLVALGGMLLVIPGMLSDILGLACLIPASRRRWAAYLLQNFVILPQGATGGAAEPEGMRVIEGEYKREE